MAAVTTDQYNDNQELVRQIFDTQADAAGGFITFTLAANVGYWWEIHNLIGQTDNGAKVVLQSPTGTQVGSFPVGTSPFQIYWGRDAGPHGAADKELLVKLPVTTTAEMTVVAVQRPTRNYNLGGGNANV